MTLTTVSGAILTARVELPAPEAGPASQGGRKPCPLSGTKGVAVKVDPTVGNHVRESTWDRLDGIEELWFCPEPSCPVVYYDDTNEAIWGVDDLKTRVGVKTDLDPVPVCYCRRVTRARIAEEILEKGCCDSLQDIKGFTRANTGELCLVTNPSGRCCGGHVRRVVEEILSRREAAGAVPPSLADEARQRAAEIPD